MGFETSDIAKWNSRMALNIAPFMMGNCDSAKKRSLDGRFAVGTWAGGLKVDDGVVAILG